MRYSQKRPVSSLWLIPKLRIALENLLRNLRIDEIDDVDRFANAEIDRKASFLPATATRCNFRSAHAPVQWNDKPSTCVSRPIEGIATPDRRHQDRVKLKN